MSFEPNNPIYILDLSVEQQDEVAELYCDDNLCEFYKLDDIIQHLQFNNIDISKWFKEL